MLKISVVFWGEREGGRFIYKYIIFLISKENGLNFNY